MVLFSHSTPLTTTADIYLFVRSKLNQKLTPNNHKLSIRHCTEKAAHLQRFLAILIHTQLLYKEYQNSYKYIFSNIAHLQINIRSKAPV